MPNTFPAAGTPARRKRMDYQNKYRRDNYWSKTLLLDRRKPFDQALIEGLSGIPAGKRMEFIKQAIADKLNK